MKTIRAFVLMATVILSHAAFAEQTSATVIHTATSGSKLSAHLSQDIYKSVPYQDTYEEQEPYQAEEQYTVDVPYQEQEAYQDTETYYENEYRCHNETSTRQECHTERICQPHPGQQQCQMVEECGTNARGEKICKTRKVCERGPDRQDCANQNVCKNVPVTEQKCGYEQVPKTRQVTKYRTVTKYRKELRTRTVTKYRTVTKCCVTKYRDEFDHTWSQDVQVILPAEATLTGTETESFRLNLVGSESAPDVNLTVIDSIYGYKLKHKDIRSGAGSIELAMAPKYNEKTLGGNLVNKVELTANRDGNWSDLSISDKGIVPRVSTVYRFQIIEMSSKKVVSQGEISSANATHGIVSTKLSETLPSDYDYAIQISATRSGVVLEKAFSFTITKQIEFTRWNADDFGAETISGLALSKQGEETALSFVDKGAHPKLTTTYKITISGDEGKVLWSQSTTASQVLDSKQIAHLALDSQVMSRSEDLKILLSVQRVGRQLNKVVQFEKSLDRPFMRLEDIVDSKKVSSIGISGNKSGAVLFFRDQILDSSRVKTHYRLVMTRKGGLLGRQKIVMSDVSFMQGPLMQSTMFSQALIRLGISSADLNNYVTSGAGLHLDLVVTRKDIIQQKVLATFTKSLDLKVQ